MRADILTSTSGLSKFRFDIAEFSGAVADLGVMLPLLVALITLNGVNATSAFCVVGLAYFINAYVYRLPVPVQPLKALAATALALGLSPGMITAAAWWMAVIFLLLSYTNAAKWLAGLFPKPVVRGIQLGLGLLLLRSAWGLVMNPSSQWAVLWPIAGFNVPLSWLVTFGSVVVLLAGLVWRRSWAGLLVVVSGLLVGLAVLGIPRIDVGLTLPSPVLPNLGDLWPAFVLLVIPQVPLSLANSVFATADAAKKYFGEQGDRASARRLLFTMGLANVAAAGLGGVPICHGSGGLTAHVRLGARTGGALILIGSLFLALGLFGGLGTLPLLSLIPFSALGVLLAYVGFQHMWLASDLRGTKDWSVALSITLIAGYTSNLAWGFAAGYVLHLLWTWGQGFLSRSAKA